MKQHTLILLLSTFFSGITIAQEQKPNIILIMCDDLGYGDTGFNGNRVIKTPNLDSVTEKAGGKKSNEEGVFNLTTDRGETNNIISKYDANLNRYKKIMDEWWKSAIKSKEEEDLKKKYLEYTRVVAHF